jgi:hypothetical protein
MAISESMTELYGDEGVDLHETIELISDEDIRILVEARKAAKAMKKGQQPHKKK